jgi:SepF-like predicted cell division protein (DUF552 family)
MGLFQLFNKTQNQPKNPPTITHAVMNPLNKPKNVIKNLLSSTSKTHNISQITLKTPQDFTLLRDQLLSGNIMVVDTQLLFQCTNQGQIQLLFENFKDFCKRNGCIATKLKESMFLITPNNHFKIDNLLN